MTAHSANSFGTFLETRQLLRKGGKAAPPLGGRPSADQDEPFGLLRLLKPDRPVAVSELLKSSEMDLIEFSSALSRLADAGLVSMSRDDEELVQLTGTGAAVRKIS